MQGEPNRRLRSPLSRKPFGVFLDWRAVEIQNRAGLREADLATLAEQLVGLESLSDVLRWGRQQPGLHPTVIADVVVQDEFTHDAIVPWLGGQALVFGST